MILILIIDWKMYQILWRNLKNIKKHLIDFKLMIMIQQIINYIIVKEIENKKKNLNLS